MDWIEKIAREHGTGGWQTLDDMVRFGQAVAAAERDRISAAIKAEDDYCVTEGDYMLDSDDCIAVARGTWKRPEFASRSNTTIQRPRVRWNNELG